MVCTKQNRRRVFSGTADDYLHLVESWGQDAADAMRCGDQRRAQLSAELAVRFAHKGGLIERDSNSEGADD